MDQIILTSSILSFCGFLGCQAVVFRFLKPEQLLKAIMLMAVWAGSADILLAGVWSVNFSFFKSITGVGVSLVLLGLLLFVYILCLFGPYETSIRMRLIREIAKAGDEGASLEHILGQYNARIMLDNRLKRLTGSGDVVIQDGIYRIEQHHNAFFLIDRLAQAMNRFINHHA